MGKPNSIRVLFFFLLSVLKISAYGQTESLREGVEVPFTVLVTENDSLTIHSILGRSSEFIQPEKISEKTNPTNTYWVKFDFSNELDRIKKDTLWYLRTYTFEYGSIFQKDNDLIYEQKIGRFEGVQNRSSKLYNIGIPFKEQSLISGKYLYLKLKRVVFFDRVSRWKGFYVSPLQNELFQSYYSNSDVKHMAPVYTFSGICLVIFILTLVFYLYSWRTEFLFYSLYVLFLFFYLSSDILNLHQLFFGDYNLKTYTFFQIAQVLVNLFYILFVMFYLNTKTDYQKLHIALKVIATILFIVALLSTVLLLSHSFFENIYLLDIERIIMTVFGLVGMIYLLIKTKDKLGYFIVIGSFLYMVGALGLLFFKIREYMIIGSSLEILVFASGLTYKMQQENKDKLRFQKESLVNENRALRAQMNPHFIFNSLSSIQNLITTEKKEAAIKYLNKFSILMRNLLESSFDTNMILSDEIALLEKYLQLEALRFNDAFNYTITVEEDLDPDSIEIPALLVQPFVENAILHGLLNKQGTDKELIVRFRIHNSLLICEIDDNGIGRVAASEKSSLLKRTNKSRGIEVTEKRLQLLNGYQDESIQITDKYDLLGNPSGTLVKIKIVIA
jgi:sensor histidine kinase YesM